MPAHTRIIAVSDGDAAVRYKSQILSEGLLDFINVPVAVQMIRVNIQNDRNCRMKLQERPVEFTGFCHKNAAVSDARTSADCIQPSADMNTRIHSAFHQDLAHHTGYGCFTMRAADTDRLRKSFHQLPEKNRTFNCGNPKPFGFRTFRIIRPDCCRIDYKISTVHILCAMTDHHLSAFFPYIMDQVSFVAVTAGHTVSLVNQHFRKPAHAAPADPDEVDTSARVIGNTILCIHIILSFRVIFRSVFNPR